MIVKASPADVGTVAGLALRLWPNHVLKALREEFLPMLSNENAAVFIFYDGANAAAFAQCQLRFAYVEGTKSSPVGYLEGIYVEPPHRKKGVAKKLLEICQAWAKEKGCAEFASDCELDNHESYAFHLRAGFVEMNKIICFAKRL